MKNETKQSSFGASGSKLSRAREHYFSGWRSRRRRREHYLSAASSLRVRSQLSRAWTTLRLRAGRTRLGFDADADADDYCQQQTKQKQAMKALDRLVVDKSSSSSLSLRRSERTSVDRLDRCDPMRSDPFSVGSNQIQLTANTFRLLFERLHISKHIGTQLFAFGAATLWPFESLVYVSLIRLATAPTCGRGHRRQQLQ